MSCQDSSIGNVYVCWTCRLVPSRLDSIIDDWGVVPLARVFSRPLICGFGILLMAFGVLHVARCVWMVPNIRRS